jgi:Na+/H+-dicarboxylate symporter
MTLFGKPLHWWVLGALLAGVVLGVGLHVLLTPSAWAGLGVQDSGAFLKRSAVPAGAIDANAGATSAAHALRATLEGAKLIGDVFLRLLRMLAVPVVLFSVIAAVAGVGDPKALGRMGMRTLGIFAGTAVLAVALAVALSTLVQPGTFVAAAEREKLAADFASDASRRIASNAEFAKSNTVLSQLLDTIPTNPFKALADGNMLQVVVFAVLLGLGLLLAQHHAREKTLHVIEALAEACLRLVTLIMKLAPLAVLCLTALLVSQLGFGVLRAMAVFVACVAGGLAVLLLVVLPGTMVLLSKRGRSISPRAFFRAMAPSHLLAFSSSSSAATMPVTLECCDAMGLPRRVSGFVIPLGTTINMNGTAFYQVMCVGFLAQAFGVPLSLTDYMGIGFMAIFIAIGSPGLPGASLVLMVFILDAFKVPAAGLALIIAVDRVLDMCRTVVNVSGDAATAAIVASWEGDARAERSPGLRA